MNPKMVQNHRIINQEIHKTKSQKDQYLMFSYFSKSKNLQQGEEEEETIVTNIIAKKPKKKQYLPIEFAG